MDAKQRIFDATLNIIKTSGMRGVRHRAVAAEAGVSLGSTTYHFKSIEDLISSTFLYWHDQIDINKNNHFISLEQDVSDFSQQEVCPELLAEKLYQDGIEYLSDQIFTKSDDRRVELAFHNEALRSVQLSQLLLASWQQETKILADLYQLLGNEFPEEDAEVTFALVLQLEKRAMLIRGKQALAAEFEKMKLILKRHIYLVTGASFTKSDG
ncbi:TetR/AcrR family transcriptional regulator [Cognaticolwellia mytili]|uniref:TetR/AcrR family transcriptional regulator n=1 Tax=Cognaticolwellia mytili TaxID=1888913 RepID=UPI000A1778FF|nr:TetR family transcriptional regulator [Cognaticolwellia mytili]